MNVYSQDKNTSSGRHLDGWNNLLTAQETGKKAGKKLKANADILDDEEFGQDDATLDFEVDDSDD